MNDILREFLVETSENLAQLDQDLIFLEKDPGERETLARVFRTLHTVKGTTGFLGLPKLQAIAHAGENLLGRLRAGELAFNPEIATTLLGVVDAIREILAALEATEQEGNGEYSELIRKLEELAKASGSSQRSRIAARSSTSTPDAASVQAAPRSLPVPDLASIVIGPTRIPIVEPEVPPTLINTVSPLNRDAGETRAPAAADTSIRVDVGLLDNLMNLVGELVLARNQIMQLGSTQEDRGFLGTLQRLNMLTTELQAGVMKTRMQPIGNVWGKFPRVVRDLAIACEKQVQLEMDGQDTELDKTIIEAIRDPLTHMVRNAVDHGIEPPAQRLAAGKSAEGRIALKARHEGGKVIIEIADDGGGIDPIRVRDKAIHANLILPEQAARMSERELVNLIFLPGFSTADRVTHFSGRGVGMDVVRTNIEKIGGTVDIESQLGRGTNVKMKIPLTLAIIPALTVSSGGDCYCIPQVNLLELVRIDREQAGTTIEFVHGVPVYRLRGNLLPLAYLDQLLQVKQKRTDQDELYIVVLQADDRPFGLVVDAIHDTEEIVVKPLQQGLKGSSALAGATIMGDGRVALILDVLGLAQRAAVITGIRERTLVEKPATSTELRNRQSLLLFAAGGGRMAIPLSQIARLEEFPRSALERASGGDVVQYRDEIMPLIHVGRTLRKLSGKTKSIANNRQRSDRTEQSSREGKFSIVVCAHEGRHVGLIVGRIFDIVEETIMTRTAAGRPGVQYSAVIQNSVTEFLDVDALIRASGTSGRVQ